MTSARAAELLKEIGKDGSDLNQKYRGWRDNAFSSLIFDLMFHLATPDKVAATTTTLPGESAPATVLGVCTGMARAVDTIQTLDEQVQSNSDIIDEDYSDNQE